MPHSRTAPWPNQDGCSLRLGGCYFRGRRDRLPQDKAEESQECYPPPDRQDRPPRDRAEGSQVPQLCRLQDRLGRLPQDRAEGSQALRSCRPQGRRDRPPRGRARESPPPRRWRTGLRGKENNESSYARTRVELRTLLSLGAVPCYAQRTEKVQSG